MNICGANSVIAGHRCKLPPSGVVDLEALFGGYGETGEEQCEYSSQRHATHGGASQRLELRRPVVGPGRVRLSEHYSLAAEQVEAASSIAPKTTTSKTKHKSKKVASGGLELLVRGGYGFDPTTGTRHPLASSSSTSVVKAAASLAFQKDVLSAPPNDDRTSTVTTNPPASHLPPPTKLKQQTCVHLAAASSDQQQLLDVVPCTHDGEWVGSIANGGATVPIMCERQEWLTSSLKNRSMMRKGLVCGKAKGSGPQILPKYLHPGTPLGILDDEVRTRSGQFGEKDDAAVVTKPTPLQPAPWNSDAAFTRPSLNTSFGLLEGDLKEEQDGDDDDLTLVQLAKKRMRQEQLRQLQQPQQDGDASDFVATLNAAKMLQATELAKRVRCMDAVVERSRLLEDPRGVSAMLSVEQQQGVFKAQTQGVVVATYDTSESPQAEEMAEVEDLSHNKRKRDSTKKKTSAKKKNGAHHHHDDAKRARHAELKQLIETVESLVDFIPNRDFVPLNGVLSRHQDTHRNIKEVLRKVRLGSDPETVACDSQQSTTNSQQPVEPPQMLQPLPRRALPTKPFTRREYYSLFLRHFAHLTADDFDGADEAAHTLLQQVYARNAASSVDTSDFATEEDARLQHRLYGSTPSSSNGAAHASVAGRIFRLIGGPVRNRILAKLLELEGYELTGPVRYAARSTGTARDETIKLSAVVGDEASSASDCAEDSASTSTDTGSDDDIESVVSAVGSCYNRRDEFFTDVEQPLDAPETVLPPPRVLIAHPECKRPGFHRRVVGQWCRFFDDHRRCVLPSVNAEVPPPTNRRDQQELQAAAANCNVVLIPVHLKHRRWALVAFDVLSKVFRVYSLQQVREEYKDVLQERLETINVLVQQTLKLSTGTRQNPRRRAKNTKSDQSESATADNDVVPLKGVKYMNEKPLPGQNGDDDPTAESGLLLLRRVAVLGEHPHLAPLITRERVHALLFGGSAWGGQHAGDEAAAAAAAAGVPRDSAGNDIFGVSTTDAMEDRMLNFLMMSKEQAKLCLGINGEQEEEQSDLLEETVVSKKRGGVKKNKKREPRGDVAAAKKRKNNNGKDARDVPPVSEQEAPLRQTMPAPGGGFSGSFL